ncbi:MAG: hypothetical protein CM15mP107_3370 [Bacteroidota bacterium]|nr:MAG: hypothetical protein CM15mP107_3370 [Bacteroidota bacterium]
MINLNGSLLPNSQNIFKSGNRAFYMEISYLRRSAFMMENCYFGRSIILE